MHASTAACACLPARLIWLLDGRWNRRAAESTYWRSGMRASREMSPRLAEHIETCLGCLGCQTACPSGVKYEKILNAARPAIAQQRSAQQRAIMRFAFERILPDYPLLHLGGWFLSLWQKLRLGAVLKWLAVPTKEYESSAERNELEIRCANCCTA